MTEKSDLNDWLTSHPKTHCAYKMFGLPIQTKTAFQVSVNPIVIKGFLVLFFHNSLIIYTIYTQQIVFGYFHLYICKMT